MENIGRYAAVRTNLIRGWRFWPAVVVAAPLRAYRRLVSPLLAPRCRFTPSCSAYAVEALQEHGLIKGVCLTVGRLARCHPFHEGGPDPVPARHQGTVEC